MSTKSRQTIYGGPIMGAKIRAEGARKRAAEAAREADRAEAEASWKPTAALRSRPQASGNVSTAGSAGLRWNAIAARHARAYRSQISAAHATRRSGNLRRR